MSKAKAKTIDPSSPAKTEVSADEYRKGMRGLTARDRLFVELYLSNGGCVAKAAEAVGYRNPGATGWRKMRRPVIREHIRRRLGEIGVNPDEVIGTLVTIMRHGTGSSDPEVVRNAIDAAIALFKVFGIDDRRPGGKAKTTL